jgi:hypothetical protein
MRSATALAYVILLFFRPQAPAPQAFDLGKLFASGKLHPVNRDVAALEGQRSGVHLSARADVGVAWIEGADFGEGTIEIDVRGRDTPNMSFVGIAFHGADDNTYESVYLRPFNFRTTDPARHHHAVQYMAPPEFDWPNLRARFPEEFENAVDASVSPTDWVPLRVIVTASRVTVYAGAVKATTLDVRKLGKQTHGKLGLWVGNNSEGDFANLRVTAK